MNATLAPPPKTDSNPAVTVREETRQATVREARSDDAAAIAAIYNESVDAGDSTMDRVHWQPAEALQKLQSAPEREIWLVLELDDQVIGWGALKSYSGRIGYQVACELSIFLRRNETGGGLAGPLLDELVRRAPARGLHHIVAKVFADNTPSRRFLTRRGFEPVGVQKDIGFIDGRWVSIALLQRVLRSAGSEPTQPAA